MKYLLIPFIALGIGSAAYAATDATSYPPCSKSVQDECSGTPQAHHAAVHHAKMHKARHVAANHHRATGKAEKSARS